MKRVFLAPCSVCLFWAVGMSLVGLVIVVLLSRFALSALAATIGGAFDLARDFLLGTIAGAAGLPGWAAFPLAFLALAAVFLIWRKWREMRSWRDLGIVREEYEPLVALLQRRGMQTYLGQVETAREAIFRERDRVEELRQLLEDELPKIETRITELSEQLGKPGRDHEKEELRTLMRDLIGNGQRLRERKSEIERFAQARVRFASSLNCLRLKLLEEPKESAAYDEIMQTIKAISLTEDAVPRSETPGSRSSATFTGVDAMPAASRTSEVPPSKPGESGQGTRQDTGREEPPAQPPPAPRVRE